MHFETPHPTPNETPDHASSHLGAGLGAAMAGTALGAIAGVIAGPAALVAGAAIGAIVGGAAGLSAEGYINPETEETYWREHFHERPYIEPGFVYTDYEPAYRFGREAQSTYRDFQFAEVEKDLAEAWETQRKIGGMTWDQARPAVLDAWRRIDEAHVVTEV